MTVMDRRVDDLSRSTETKISADATILSNPQQVDSVESLHISRQVDRNGQDRMNSPRRQLEKDGPVTLGHLLATNNRLTEYDLGPDRLQIDKYTPVFVHDVLMLPGSLAQVLGKRSETDLIPRLTPACIPGHRKVAHPDHGEACIIPVPDGETRAHGMLVFGQGAKRRALIEQHYGISAVKTTLKAVFEIAKLAPHHRAYSEPRYYFPPVEITVEAFLPTAEQQAMLRKKVSRDWVLREFLQGEYLV